MMMVEDTKPHICSLEMNIARNINCSHSLTRKQTKEERNYCVESLFSCDAYGNHNEVLELFIITTRRFLTWIFTELVNKYL